MSSEESEEEGGEEPPRTPVRPPRPQAVSEGSLGWGGDPQLCQQPIHGSCSRLRARQGVEAGAWGVLQ